VEHQYEVYPKRQKQSSIECNFRGKLGHKIFECRLKKQQHHLANDKERHVRHDAHRREKSSVTFYKCGDWGHISTQCTKKEADRNKTFNREKRVDQCSVAVLKGSMNQRNAH